MALHIRRMSVIAAAVVAVVAIGCSSRSSWAPQEPSVDGWPLGTAFECREPVNMAGTVVDLVGMASRRLPDPHPGMTDVRCYEEGLYLSDGQPVIIKRSSGGMVAVVFSFVDGTRKAIGLGCFIGGCGSAEPPRERPEGIILTRVSE